MSKTSAKSGAITIDQATAILGRKPREDEVCECASGDDAGEGEDLDSLAVPMAGDADGAETRTDGDDEAEEADQAEDDESEPAPLKPPKFWDAEAKKRFGELPRDVQEIIVAKEDERNTATARALQEAAEKRKALDAEGARLGQLMTGLDHLVPKAVEAFQHRWQNVDWNRMVSQHGPEQAQKMRGQFEADQNQVQQLRAARNQAHHLGFRNFVASEEAKLASLSPDLAHAKLGQGRKAALGKFLLELGVPAGRIPYLTAHEAALAYDAMRWRNGQSTADTLVKAQAPAQARRTPAKPVAAAGPRSATHARVGQLSKKRELSIEEAVELANLKGHY